MTARRAGVCIVTMLAASALFCVGVAIVEPMLWAVAFLLFCVALVIGVQS